MTICVKFQFRLNKIKLFSCSPAWYFDPYFRFWGAQTRDFWSAGITILPYVLSHLSEYRRPEWRWRAGDGKRLPESEQGPAQRDCRHRSIDGRRSLIHSVKIILQNFRIPFDFLSYLIILPIAYIHVFPEKWIFPNFSSFHISNKKIYVK